MAAPAIHYELRDVGSIISIRVPGDKTFIRVLDSEDEVVDTLLLPEVSGVLARLNPGQTCITTNGVSIIIPQTPMVEAASREMLAYYQDLPDDKWKDFDEEPAAPAPSSH
jgi:hypothetical protein